ncbi:hypothetical protein V8F20_000430 [Naviculisporaceae sp. PSN 640]
MHPAPTLAEAPPKSDEQRPRQHSPAGPENGNSHAGTNGSLEQHAHHSDHSTTPVRKDTNSSTSTNATAATLATLASNESAATTYSVEASPSFPSQAVFSVKDGSDVVAQRRPSRRRTGPLSNLQRERAALIRKLGACSDCRRRRVACHPNHHNMTWEEAARKYKSHSPTLPDLAPLGGRPLSPATPNSKPVFTQDPQEMDIDPSPSQQAGRSVLNESRIRKPLPSGPRPDKPTTLPGIDSFNPDLQRHASRILADPHHSRYTMVSALLVHWQDDDDHGARAAMNEFRVVLDEYNYTFQMKAIPSSSDGHKSSFRWLSREVQDFIDNNDQRDVLKIVYYSGYSYLDGNRDMVLSSSKNHEPTSAIRWSAIQQLLEDASSDILIIMDSAYYPSSQLVKRQGVLELIAASASEDHVGLLGRSAFTRALCDQLRARASQKSANPLSAAELHARLLPFYSKIVHDRSPERQMVTSFPSPLHFQVSGTKLPSILLAPMHKVLSPFPPESPTSGASYMNITFRLSDEPINTESWVEWLRLMPDGIREVKVEGPNRNTFR